MKRWTSLCKIELKRNAKILPWLFFQTAKVVFVVLIICVVFSKLSNQEVLKKIKIGVAADNPGKNEEIVISTLKNMESINSFCIVEEMSISEAEKALESGEISVAIYIPKKFVRNIAYGINTPATIALSEQSSLNSSVLREVADSGARMLSISQSAIYALGDAADDYKLKVNQSDMEYEVSLRYLNVALSREKLFKTKNVSAFYNRSSVEYYGAILAVVLTFLSLMSCASLYNHEDRAVKRYIYSRGMGVTGAMIAEFVGTMVVTSAVYVFWIVVLNVAEYKLGLTDGIFLGANLPIAVITAVSISSFAHMILVLFRKGRNAGQAMVLMTGLMIMLGGGIAPPAVLPRAASLAGSILPFRYWVEGLLAQNNSLPWALLPTAIWAPIALVVSVVWEKRRLKNG